MYVYTQTYIQQNKKELEDEAEQERCRLPRAADPRGQL